MAGRDAFDERLEIAEVVEFIVQQVRTGNVRERRHYRTADERGFLFEFVYEPLHACPFQVRLRAATG